MVQAQGKIRQGFQLHKSDVISIKIRAIEKNNLEELFKL